MERKENILGANRKFISKNISIRSIVFAVTIVLGISIGVYGLENTEVKKLKGKIAVVISPSDDGYDSKSLQNLLEVQNKYKIPVTWVLNSKLFDAVEQNQLSDDFFIQARKNNSDFILTFPNIDATIFMNGDEEYIKVLKDRTEFVEETLAKTNYKLKYYSANPIQMERFLANRGLKSALFQHYLEVLVSYEKDCIRSNQELSCQPINVEKQKEIRENYLQFINEFFELNSNYYDKKYGKEITQVLQLKTNKLTDDCADELFQMLKNKGYEIVPLEDATIEKPENINEDLVKDNDLRTERIRLMKKYSLIGSFGYK